MCIYSMYIYICIYNDICVYMYIYMVTHTTRTPHHQSLSNLSASWKTVQFNALRGSKMGRETAWTTRNGDKRLKCGGVPPFGYVPILCTVPQKDDMDSVQWGFNARNLWLRSESGRLSLAEGGHLSWDLLLCRGTSALHLQWRDHLWTSSLWWVSSPG